MADPYKDLPIKKATEAIQNHIDGANPLTDAQILKMFKLIMTWINRFEENFGYFNDDDVESPL